MVTFLRRSTALVWIACFAILLNALAPSISHALDAIDRGATLLEICTASGPRLVAGDHAASDKPAGGGMDHGEPCPFCLTHAGSFALPPSLQVPLLAMSDNKALYPALFYHSPSPLFSWSRAQSRAPPAIS